MNKKVKSGLIFGIPMAILLILQSLLTKGNLTTKDYIISISSGVLTGAIFGFLFVWLTGKLGNSKLYNTAAEIDIQQDESMVFQTPASHYKGIEAVGGILYLTNKRLVFKSHKLNIQNHELSIKLSDIKQVSRYKSIGFINNGLIIQTIQQTNDSFIVEKAAEWISHLK